MLLFIYNEVYLFPSSFEKPLNEFKKVLLATTKLKVLFKDNNGWKHFFEMGEYGLLKTYYTPKGNLGGWERILNSPFKILELESKDNKTIYRIKLLLENRIWEKNEIIEVENCKQFRKELDNKLIIVLPKHLRNGYKLIILKYKNREMKR